MVCKPTRDTLSVDDVSHQQQHNKPATTTATTPFIFKKSNIFGGRLVANRTADFFYSSLFPPWHYYCARSSQPIRCQNHSSSKGNAAIQLANCHDVTTMITRLAVLSALPAPLIVLLTVLVSATAFAPLANQNVVSFMRTGSASGRRRPKYQKRASITTFGLPPDKDITNIYYQNAGWKQRMTQKDEKFFEKLGSSHNPKYMWIGTKKKRFNSRKSLKRLPWRTHTRHFSITASLTGCADARVPANVVMGEDAGSVFVLRNVANMVVNTDFNLMAGLQFGVDSLKISHIIVCGHYDCGGVRASVEAKDHVPPLENWLRNIRDV